jgi:hypothetical protein
MPSKQPRSGPHRTRVRTGATTSTGEVVEILSEEPVNKKAVDASRPSYGIIAGSAKKLEMSPTSWRILIALVDAYQINAEKPFAKVTQAELAADLGLALRSIEDAMREMRDRRIIFRQGRSGWFVNPHIAYRGTIGSWDTDRWDHRLPMWRRSNPGLRVLDEDER